MAKHSGKNGAPSILWGNLNRAMAYLYGLIARSLPGRIMSGYRRVDDVFSGRRRYPGRHRCSPMSPARQRLVEAVESGHLFVGIRALFHALFCAPLIVYGLFGLAYGLCGVACYFIVPFISTYRAPDTTHMILSAIMALLSIPFLMTRKSLAEALGGSAFCRRLLTGFLGIPADRLHPRHEKTPAVLPYVFAVLGILGGVAALFVPIWVIPAVFALIGLLGLIFTYPEAGVVLATLTLPVIWLDRSLLYLPALLIFLTWCSYGVKLLFLHRTIRFGILDVAVLLLGVLILLSGFTGAVVTVDTVVISLLLFVCLSLYFLIVNLMTTRAYIRRCLAGVGISVLLVTLLSYLRIIPVDDMAWLTGSRAGNYIVDTVHAFIEELSGLWVEHSELFLVLVFPWLYAYLFHTRRVFRKTVGLLFIALALALILMTHSISALICVLAVTLIFFLLMDHRWLAAGIVSLPTAVCGGLWLTYLYPVSDAVQTILSRSRLFKSQLRESLWEMVLDHPAGIGVGDDAFAAVYPQYAAPDLGAVGDSGTLLFEVLLNYGWVGLILFAIVLFLFAQKSMTCLGHTAATKDRAVILGGLTSLVGALIFGTVRSFVTAPRVFFTLLLVVAICSAYENIVFDESDVLCADGGGSPEGEDRIWRKG